MLRCDMPLILTSFENESLPQVFSWTLVCFESKSSYKWLFPNWEWIYKEQSLKYILESRYDCLKSYTLSHRQELTFAIVEGKMYHLVNVIHQPYINLIHQFIHSRLFSMLKIVWTVKADNETHNQLKYTCNVTAKPIT